jgi:hypothetical protein
MKQLPVLLKSEAAKVLAINLSVMILVPVAVGILAPMIRPTARAVLKTGILAYEKVREGAAEFGEMMEDLVAEVQEELQEAKGADAGLTESGKPPRQERLESTDKKTG